MKKETQFQILSLMLSILTVLFCVFAVKINSTYLGEFNYIKMVERDTYYPFIVVTFVAGVVVAYKMKKITF